MEVEQQANSLVARHDELPVGRSSQNGPRLEMTEFPEGKIPPTHSTQLLYHYHHHTYNESTGHIQQQNFQPVELPIEKRIISVNWKTRQQALEQLSTLCESAEGLEKIAAELQSKFPKLIQDNNPLCLKLAFKGINQYISKTHLKSENVAPFLKAIIQKCFTASKPDLVKSGFVLIEELFEQGLKDNILKSIWEGLKNKNPKIVSSCIDLSIHLLICFGLRRLDLLKPFFVEIEKLAENTNSQVKNSLLMFYKEAYKWLGEPLFAFTGKLKKNQVDELEKFKASYEMVSMIPTRVDQNNMAQQCKGGNSNKPIDIYDIVDPIDAIGKYDESWAQKVVTIEKWSEKKQALDSALKMFEAPKLVPRDTFHLHTLIKRLLGDSNVNIQICGIKLARCLCSGLKKNFAQGAKIIHSLLLQKLKDKKTNILDETHKTLKVMLQSITLDDMLDTIKQCLTDKASFFREQVLIFLINNVTKRDQKMFKTFLDLLHKLTSDGAAEVRDKACELVLKIRDTFGSKFLTDKFNKVPKLVEKLKQYVPAQTQQPSHNSMPAAPSKFSNSMVIEPSGEATITNPVSRVNRFNQIPNQQQTSQQSAPQKPMISLDSKKGTRQAMVPEEPTIKFDSVPAAFSLQPSKSLLPFGRKVEEPAPPKEIKKKLIPQIHALIPLMSNLNSRSKIQGCQNAMALLQKSAEYENDYNQSAIQINQLSNVIRTRIAQKDTSVSKKFIQLAGVLLRKGIVTATRGRVIVPALLLRFTDPQVGDEIQQVINDMLETCPPYLLSHLPPLLTSSNDDAGQDKMSILRILEIHNTQFLQFAEPKAFIVPLMDLLVSKNDEIANLAQRLLDQLLERFDDNALQKIVKQMKVQLPEYYLKKWRINIPAANQYSANSNSNGPRMSVAPTEPYPGTSGVAFLGLASKLDRKRMQHSNPWPITASRSHIMQLIATLSRLPPPFPEMASPLPVTSMLVNSVLCSGPILVQYSDIIIKWLHYRFIVERKEGVIMLFEVARAMVTRELDEMEMIILLAGVLSTLRLGDEVLQQAAIFNQMFKVVGLQEKVLRFWVNSLQETHAPVNEILYILQTAFPDLLLRELVSLARIQAVRVNEQFNQYLRRTYDPTLLKVYGFQVNVARMIRRESVNLHHYQIPFDIKPLVEAIQQLPPDDALREIDNYIVSNSLREKSLQIYVQILEGCLQLYKNQPARPAFNSFVHMISNRFFELSIMSYLKPLLKVLINLLVILQRHKSLPEFPSDQQIKIVNSLIIKSIQNIHSEATMSAIFGILEDELKVCQYNKAMAIASKCLSRICKTKNFLSSLPEMISNFVGLVMRLFNRFSQTPMKAESQLLKNLRLYMMEWDKEQPDLLRRLAADALDKHRGNIFIQSFFCELKMPAEPTTQMAPMALTAPAQQGITQMLKQRFGQLKEKMIENNIVGINMGTVPTFTQNNTNWMKKPQ